VNTPNYVWTVSFCDARRLLAAGDRLAIDDHVGSDLVTSAVGDGRGESFRATLKIEFYNRDSYGRLRLPLSSPSATGSNEFTTGADTTRPSV
jgi:hypothetical protein